MSEDLALGGTLGAPADKFAPQTGGFRDDIGSVKRLLSSRGGAVTPLRLHGKEGLNRAVLEAPPAPGLWSWDDVRQVWPC